MTDTPVFNSEAPYGRVTGDCLARYSQNGQYFAPNGTHIPWDDKFLTPSEYEAKHGPISPPKAPGSQVHKPAEDAPLGEQTMIGKPDEGSPANPAGNEGPDMVAERQKYSDELKGYTPMQIKKLVEEADLKPVTGRGSTAQNIDLLLDKYAPVPEA